MTFAARLANLAFTLLVVVTVLCGLWSVGLLRVTVRKPRKSVAAPQFDRRSSRFHSFPAAMFPFYAILNETGEPVQVVAHRVPKGLAGVDYPMFRYQSADCVMGWANFGEFTPVPREVALARANMV